MQVFIQQERLGKGTLGLMALAIAALVWLTFEATSTSTPVIIGTASGATDTACETEADVIRAAERSRNGISMSCNMEILDQVRAAR